MQLTNHFHDFLKLFYQLKWLFIWSIKFCSSQYKMMSSYVLFCPTKGFLPKGIQFYKNTKERKATNPHKREAGTRMLNDW